MRVAKKRSEIMSAIRAKHTGCELQLRKCLSALGLRYRLHKAGLPGRPDIVFVCAKVAVFCDGDFWHGRKWKARQANGQFKVRRRYWTQKIEENIRRDRRVNRKLRKLGWLVLRYWESEIRKSGPEIGLEVAKSVRRRLALNRRRKIKKVI